MRYVVCSVSLLQVVVDMCIVVCKDICACNGHHRIYTVVAGGVYIGCVYMYIYTYTYTVKLLPSSDPHPDTLL